MARKYSGPLRPGEKSAIVPRSYYKKRLRGKWGKRCIHARRSRTPFKSNLFKFVETEFSNMGFNKTDLKHNKLTHINNVNFVSNNLIAQGLKDNQRQGNEIYVTGVRLRLLLGQPSDRPNVTFEIF